jgi:hypothetical protein
MKTRILLCGGEAVIETDDCGEPCGERCIDCLCVVGSIGMPAHCKSVFEKEEIWRVLKRKK